jgi:hypothetical protein
LKNLWSSAGRREWQQLPRVPLLLDAPTGLPF